jgi:hypothetical protein
MKLLCSLMLALLAMCMPVCVKAYEDCRDVMIGQEIDPVTGFPSAPILERRCETVPDKVDGLAAIAFSLQTRGVAAVWGYKDAEQAMADAKRKCVGECVALSFPEDKIYVAMSNDDQYYGVSKTSGEDAIRECTAKGAQTPCDHVISAQNPYDARYWKFGAVAYDAATGKSGQSWGHKRSGEAIAAAKKACGAVGCWVYVAEMEYVAIAKSEAGQLFGGTGANSTRDAAKVAAQACKEAGGKRCDVVVRTSSHQKNCGVLCKWVEFTSDQ